MVNITRAVPCGGLDTLGYASQKSVAIGNIPRSNVPQLVFTTLPMALSRHTIFYLGGRVASAAIGVFALFSFTRVLTSSDYGKYSIAVAVAGLVAGVVFQWLRQSLVKFWMEKSRESKRVLGTLGLLFISLAIVVAICTILLSVIEIYINPTNAPLILVIGVLAISQAWFELTLDGQRAGLEPLRYSVAGILRSILCLLFGLSIAMITNRLSLVILSISMGYLLASVYAIPRWMLGIVQLCHADVEQVREYAIYGLPLALALCFTVLLDSVDVFMIAIMSGATQAGIYAAAYNLAQYAIGTLLAGVGLATFPIAAIRYSKDGSEGVSEILGRNLIIIVALALPASVGLSMVSPTLTHLLLGNYSPGQSAAITAIIAIGIAVGAVRAYAFDIVFMIVNKTKLQAVILALSAGFNIVLNIIFISGWGVIGAAFATLLSFGLALILSIRFATQLVKVPIDFDGLTKISISAAAMGAVIWMVNVRGQTVADLIENVAIGIASYSILIFILNPAKVRARLMLRYSQRAS